MQQKFFTSILLTFVLLVISPLSHAVLQDEIQVYDDEINDKGEFSLELHLNTTPNGVRDSSYPGEIMNQGNTRLTPGYASAADYRSCQLGRSTKSCHRERCPQPC